jgi:hypothetical protein
MKAGCCSWAGAGRLGSYRRAWAGGQAVHVRSTPMVDLGCGDRETGSILVKLAAHASRSDLVEIKLVEQRSRRALGRQVLDARG